MPDALHLLLSNKSKIAFPHCGRSGYPGALTAGRAAALGGSLISVYTENIHCSKEEGIAFRSPDYSPAGQGAPERRCSSRTFRYGYLVTT